MASRIQRPGCLYLRARPEWAELLPHLKQIGIKAVAQEVLPKWDRNFGDLQAQVEQARAATARRGKPVARAKKSAAKGQRSTDPNKVRLLTLEVFLLSGPITG